MIGDKDRRKARGMRMKISDTAIRNLSVAQRDYLIRHVAIGRVPVNTGGPTAGPRISLSGHGLIRGFPLTADRPRHTELTEHGRYAACLLLGDYADALVLAGFLELPPDERPLATLQRMKAERSQMNPAKSPNLKNSTNPTSSSSDIGR
jgi:hypothetical protein